MSTEKTADRNKDKRKKGFISIGRKVGVSSLICFILLMSLSLWLLSDSMNKVEQKLIENWLDTTIYLLRQELGESEERQWSMHDGALYLGDTLIGDGTKEHANLDAFLRMEYATGALSYVLMRTNNDKELQELDAVGNKSYEQGHYIRIAGTTKGPNGERLEGTYLDKVIADGIEKDDDGVFIHLSNVYGRMIYCRYEMLYEKGDKSRPIGLISNGMSEEELMQLVKDQKKRGYAIFIVFLLVISVGLGRFIFNILRSINKIRDRLCEIGTGEFPKEPLVLNSKDEIGEMAESVNEMVKSLKENQRIVAELSLATDIQRHMLPSEFPAFPEYSSEFDIYAMMNPAKEIGGDFYDFFMLDNKHIALVIADVAGKGVPAALVMMIAKIMIKNQTLLSMQPDDVLTIVNQMFCEDSQSGLFVTVWLGIFNIETGLLTFANAGHNPPAIKLSGEDFSFLRNKPNLVLAGMEGTRYHKNEIIMHPGDRLLLYTDGVTEATNEVTELYGEARLKSYLDIHAADSATELIHGIRTDIDRFTHETEQFDDITMLVFDYKKRLESNAAEQKFKANTEELPQVTEFIESELNKLNCPVHALMQISVAAEEIFVNIAKYAYGETSSGVAISIFPEKEGVSVCFKDRGLPFDPLAQKDPDITLAAESRQIGGLGIFIVKKTMDKVDYKYTNSQNILTITKFF